ncbi:MAG: hypothetical protein ISS45_02625 [Candidatus Omnitrophica bacterium]|nr:hypothetical protein [Candidatus Omnitrophota bacterium]
MLNDILEINLGEVLGATEASSIQQLTLYIPNKDKDDREIKHIRTWIKEAQKVLTIIGRGSTTMPPADGTWLKKDIDSMKKLKDEDILWEKTTIIYTYINPDRFEKNLKSLREFLHRFGRETNQGEVAFEFAGEFFRIREYDSK